MWLPHQHAPRPAHPGHAAPHVVLGPAWCHTIVLMKIIVTTVHLYPPAPRCCRGGAGRGRGRRWARSRAPALTRSPPPGPSMVTAVINGF